MRSFKNDWHAGGQVDREVRAVQRNGAERAPGHGPTGRGGRNEESHGVDAGGWRWDKHGLNRMSVEMRAAAVAMLLALPLAAQGKLTGKSFLPPDYTNVVAVDLAAMRTLGIWDDIEASVLK